MDDGSAVNQRSMSRKGLRPFADHGENAGTLPMRRLSLVRRLTRNGTSRGDERPTVGGDPEEWPVGGNPENIQSIKPYCIRYIPV